MWTRSTKESSLTRSTLCFVKPRAIRCEHEHVLLIMRRSLRWVNTDRENYFYTFHILPNLGEKETDGHQQGKMKTTQGEKRPDTRREKQKHTRREGEEREERGRFGCGHGRIAACSKLKFSTLLMSRVMPVSHRQMNDAAPAGKDSFSQRAAGTLTIKFSV